MEELLAPLGIDVALLPDQRARRRARGTRHRRQPRPPRGRVARLADRRRHPGPDALRPVRAEPRVPRRPGRDGGPRVPRGAGPGPRARPAVRHDEAHERGVKALVYLGPGRMELQDAPEPAPGPGEVVIASRASSICGSDLHGFREASPRRIPPLIMGHETVGTIDAVGDGVPASRDRRTRRAEADRRVRRLSLVPRGRDQPLPDGAARGTRPDRRVRRAVRGACRRRRAVRRGRLGRGRDAHRAARERGARGVAGRHARRPRLRDRRRSDRRADGEGRAAVRGVAGADHRPRGGPAAAGRGPGRGARDRRRPGAGRHRRDRRRGRRRRDRRRRLRGHVGDGAPGGPIGGPDRRGRARRGVGHRRLLRRARQGGDDHRARTRGATPTSPGPSSS